MSAAPDDRTLLLAEDDAVFVAAMSRALRRRGFDVVAADTAATALALGRVRQPRYAVVDLKLGADSGLALIPALRAALPRVRILLLTGYASIATAVEAIKLGAHDYLAKPVDADAVVRALLDDANDAAGEGSDAPETSPPLRRLEWEHIQRILHECDGNISETARRLGMHRRTLQRKLDKRPVRERPLRDQPVN
ncbi:MAG: response regulator transcription factor [Rhodanobacteraceae bacterium]